MSRIPKRKKRIFQDRNSGIWWSKGWNWTWIA